MIGEMVSAPLGRRALAFAIDLGLVAVASTPAVIGWAGLLPHLMSGSVALDQLVGATFASVVLIAVGGTLALVVQVVQIVVQGRRGVTLGKKLLGLRTIRFATLERPGVGRMMLRAVTLGASGLVVPLLGAAVMLASPLWASNTLSRGWLDLVGGNWLVDVRAGLDPYDAKAVRLARKRLEQPETELAAVPSLATGDTDAAAYIPGPRSRSAIVGAPLQPGVSDAAIAAVVDRTPAPVITAPPPSAPPTPVLSSDTPAATLLGADGLRYALTGPALVGRDPSPADGQPSVARIVVADETRSISKTHARLDPVTGGVWVLDLHSSNGSVVVNGAGTSIACEPDVPVLATWGSRLYLGDCEFVVEQAGGSPA